MTLARPGASRVHVPNGMATGHVLKPSAAIQLEGIEKQRIERGRNRLGLAALVFLGCFAIVGARVFDLSVIQGGGEPALARSVQSSGGQVVSSNRADIVDRNNIPLAMNLEVQSLSANPRVIIDPVEASEKLVQLFPDLNYDSLLGRLDSERKFVWIKRRLTPREQASVLNLGIPGLEFHREERRVYPQAHLAAHVLGYVDTDNEGLAGIERSFNSALNNPAALEGPLQLSLDIRVQHAVHDALSNAVEEFKAKGGLGVVADVRTGEVLSMVSLPDFNPNVVKVSDRDALFNRAALGTYEMGSTFKVFTAAAALEEGVATVTSRYDATKPLRIARFSIRDYHAEKRVLNVPEILIHSSNIGSAKIARDLGIERHRAFLDKLGMLRKSDIELPEVGRPLIPNPWREINTLTIGFGHGLSVTPVNLVAGISAMVNGGVLRDLTLVKQEEDGAPGTRVISRKTSENINQMMRLVVQKGSGRRASVDGYAVMGKTGTAEKATKRGYDRSKLYSSFVGVFPGDDPAYVVYVALDEPVGNESTFGYETGGWVAAPVVGKVISRIGPMLGVAPSEERDMRAEPTLYVPQQKGGRG